MSSGTKKTLQEATAAAKQFRDLFDPSSYVRWEFAGSLRRNRLHVGDIEHVIEPRFGEVESGVGLFAIKEQANLLFHRLDQLAAKGTVCKHIYGTTGFRWGEKYRGIDFAGFTHEMYLADSANWGAILLIRTGPHEFSRRVVEAFNHGGMYRQQDGYLRHFASGEVVEVPDEQTYLRLAGMKYVEPGRRA